MPGHRDPYELRRNLRAIWVDGIAYSLMVGMGETYLPAFALALGFTDVLSGLVATLPMLCGSILQLASPVWIRRGASLRRWAVVCAAAQAASFVPLCLAALAGSMPVVLLYVAAAGYWAAGLATIPVWNAWVETLIPPKLRIAYFARRWRVLHVSVLGGVFSAGWILEALAPSHPTAVEAAVDVASGPLRPLYGFALIFGCAGLARAFSAWTQAHQTEPVPMPSGMRPVGWRKLARRSRHGRDGRLLAYMMALQFSVQVSAPFLTAFMLGPLHLSYATYMGLLSAAVLGKFAGLPFFAWIARRFGVRALLWIGGIGTIPASLLWLVSERVPVLFAVQVYAGACWAAYELATFLMFFEAIPASERVSVLTKFNVANSAAIVLGSLCGGSALASFGGGWRAFAALFAISAALRLATVVLLRRVEPVGADFVGLSTDTLAVRQAAGTVEQPVLSSATAPRRDSPPHDP